VGVYLAYVGRDEHALVDVRLYLPKEWAKDKPRRTQAGVPKAVRFRTRHELALEMLDQRGPLLPHAWVAGDDEMGRCSWFRQELRARGERYLLAVPSNTAVRDLRAWCKVASGPFDSVPRQYVGTVPAGTAPENYREVLTARGKTVPPGRLTPRPCLGSDRLKVLVDADWLHWDDDCVLKIATTIVRTNDRSLLPVLADAGCDDELLLEAARSVYLSAAMHILGK
jgi:hypothetical protein